MGKKTTVIAGDRSAALRFVEEVHTLTEGGNDCDPGRAREHGG